MFEKYDAIVFIGRFQPLHNAHLNILKTAHSMANKVIVIVGSADQPRSPENPFSFEERKAFIYAAIDNSLARSNTAVEPSHDSWYNNQAWAIRTAESVAKHTKPGDRIAIIGHKKPGDVSTFYLDMFPQWDFVDYQTVLAGVDATKIREIYFNPKLHENFLESVIPDEVMRLLRKFKTTPDYGYVVDEINFIIEHAKQYAHLRYPPTFNTADAVVVQAGHILMIKRRAVPGKGQWALPGGYINARTDASLEDAAIRELDEETGIKVPAKVLRGNIKESHTFDAIKRSPRGRIITQAFYIVLPEGPLPKVKGADDAEKAKWIPIAELNRAEVFEDHYQIIQYFVGN